MKLFYLTENILFASKLTGLVTNFNINLVISRRVNANALPDVPKPLYQREGGAFRALGAQTAHAPFGDTIHLG
jgi:hypothetical protein